jgi:hypothetical protein
MHTIKSISYIVREGEAGFCIIESLILSDNKTYQRGIQYGLIEASASAKAANMQANYDGYNIRPVTI